jgi:hypothetical protein
MQNFKIEDCTMYIVCWVTHARRSYWAAFEDKADAQREYDRLSAHPKTYTVTIAGVMQSTDYGPAPEMQAQ